MNARLLRLWDSLRASYWLIPALMTLAAASLSQLLLWADNRLVDAGVGALWLHGAGEPEGARALLSTLAGSMITVAGVTFSTLLVALSLTASQYGPRLLHGFLRDRGNQAVLGTFIATFVYCLLVLRNVPVTAGSDAVPQLSVLAALALGMASVTVLIYFIHHAASSIQASSVISVAGEELDDAIRQTFPAREEGDRVWADQSLTELLPEGFAESAHEVAADESGYVQEIDTSGLVELARSHDLVIEVLHDRGGFVAEGQPLARVSAAVDEDTAAAIADGLVLAAHRASSRDVVRGVGQLAEIAVRALSPGINDPFTASAALRRLGQSLSLLGTRRLPTPTHLDEEGTLRLVVPTPEIPDLLELAFDQARHYGASDPHVPVVLLEVLASVGLQSNHPGLRRALLRHATAVQRASLAALEDEMDRERVEATHRTVAAALRQRD